MKFNYILLIVLCILIVSTSITYFMVASQEYSGMLDALSAGIPAEVHETQVETSVFIGAGVVYLGLLVWIFKSRFKNITPFVFVPILSAGLIVLYIASRTVGVPIIGVEYYIGKIDILTKILQTLMIINSLYFISMINKMSIKQLKL